MNEHQLRVEKIHRHLKTMMVHRSGVGVNPSQDGVCSTESISTDIRQKTDYAVEIIDDYIREQSQLFYAFTRIYKENHLSQFMQGVESIDCITGDDALAFKDDIRWCEDEDQVQQLRRPVSDAYLNLFNSPHDDQVVTPEDFWKCLDFKALQQDLVKAPDFQGISNLFLIADCGKKLNFLYQLTIALSSAVEDTSKMYEDVISLILKRIARRESIGPTEKIAFDDVSSTVQGITLTALIPNTVHRIWYRTKTLSPLRASGDDTKLLLSDPQKLCTGDDEIQPDDIHLLVRNLRAQNTQTDLLGVQREIINVVDSVTRASKRLTVLLDQIREIPETEVSGLNAYAIDDMTVLCGMYAITLKETLSFSTQTAKALEMGYQSGIRLAQKLERLKQAADQYIKVRKP